MYIIFNRNIKSLNFLTLNYLVIKKIKRKLQQHKREFKTYIIFLIKKKKKQITLLNCKSIDKFNSFKKPKKQKSTTNF